MTDSGELGSHRPALLCLHFTLPSELVQGRISIPDYALSSSGPLSAEKSDQLGQKAAAKLARKRYRTSGWTPELRGKAGVFLQHELRT